MIDTHYDLLSIAYVAYLRNDYSYLEKVSHYFHKNNVVGVIANLYFMSEEEMARELHPKYYQRGVSVLEMFRIAKRVLDSYLTNVDILYSIEGADYILDTKELEQLYEEGLDCLVIAWNTRSKYASGGRSHQGLTDKGKHLLRKAISLGMGIDLSHANRETFSNMISLIKEEQYRGQDVCCYASHSNAFALCHNPRNLEDWQLQDIFDVRGQVGVFAHRNFVVEEDVKNSVTAEEKKDIYLKHIEYITSFVGIDNVMLATDDMDFVKDYDSEYGETSIYDYSKLSSEVFATLKEKYSDHEIKQIMYSNVKEKIFDKIKNNRKRRRRNEK